MKQIYFLIKTARFIPFKLTLLLFFLHSISYAQMGTINGYIKLADGKPVENLRIVLEEISFSTITDHQGYFEISNLQPNDYTIKIFAGEQLLQTEATMVSPDEITHIDITIHNFSLQYLSEIMINGSKKIYVAEKPSGSLRLGEDLIEVPQNIAVVNAQTIRDIGAKTTDDILRTAAGVLPTSNAGQDIFTMIRGTTTLNSILRNGIGSGYYYNMNPDAAMIDRVEFVKGPAGFMISNASPGGMINIVTKKPTHTKTLNAELGYGSWNMLRAVLDLGGEAKKGSAFTYRLNTGIQHQERPYHYGYFTKYFLASALKYEINQNTDLSFEYNFTHGKSLDDVRYLPTINGQLFIVPNNMLISDPNASGVASFDHYMKLSFHHKFNEHWTLNAHVGMVFGEWNANGYQLDVYHDGGVVSNDTIYRYAYNDNYNNNLYNAIAFLQGKYNSGKHIKHSIMVGLDIGKTYAKDVYNPQTNNQNNLYYPAPTYHIPKNELQYFEGEVYNSIANNRYEALYLQDHIKVYNKCIITLAMRYTISHTASSDDTAITQTDKKITPRFGLTYLLNNFSLYAIMDEAFMPQVGKSLTGKQFEPLTGNNKEIGLKSFWLERKLSINLSIYRTVQNNALTLDPDNPNFLKATGQSIAKGIELDIIGQIINNISILANYAYTDSRITKSNIATEVGLYTFNAPVHSIANLFVKYRFTDKTFSGLSLSAGLQYKDKFSSSYSENSYLPGYTLLEAAAGYNFKQWYVNFNVYNLTNKKYINFGSKYNDTDWTYSPGMPVNFRVGIGFRLG